jgi:hypothetical protein
MSSSARFMDGFSACDALCLASAAFRRYMSARKDIQSEHWTRDSVPEFTVYAHLAPSYVADTIRAPISRGLGLQRKARVRRSGAEAQFRPGMGRAGFDIRLNRWWWRSRVRGAANIALLRSRLHKILAEARAAKKLPWEPTRLSLCHAIFPKMTHWLPEEGAQLRFDFEVEPARLEAA